MGQNHTRRVCFVEFAGWRHRRRSLPSQTASRRGTAPQNARISCATTSKANRHQMATPHAPTVTLHRHVVAVNYAAGHLRAGICGCADHDHQFVTALAGRQPPAKRRPEHTVRSQHMYAVERCRTMPAKSTWTSRHVAAAVAVAGALGIF